MNTWADLRGGDKGVMPPQKLASTSFRRGRVVPLEYKKNLLEAGATPRTPLGELAAFPKAPQLVGRGLASPFLRTPPPLSAL